MSGFDICGDNRFELVEKYRAKLIYGTNIEDRPEEMAVIDNILFRFWQMGWLDQLERSDSENEQLKTENAELRELSKFFHYKCCDTRRECNELKDKIDKLVDENAKLSDLIRYMWYADYAGHFSTLPNHQEHKATVWQRIHELGVMD